MAQELPLAGVHSGMILARPAYDVLGNRLFDTGTVLHDRQLRVLRAWGVRSVVVLMPGEVPESDQAVSAGHGSGGGMTAPQPADGAQTRLARMFEPHQGNALMDHIRTLAEAHLAREEKSRKT